MHEFTDTALDRIAAATSEPDLVTDARRSALKRHNELDGPIVDVEAWKNTSLEGFDLQKFAPAAEKVEISGAEALRAAGGFAGSLGEAVSTIPAVAEAFQRMSHAASEDFFSTLVTAFHAAAIAIYVPRSAHVEEPVVLARSVTSKGDAVFPLTVVVADENSSVTVIDRSESQPLDGEALAVHATYIDAGQASQATYLVVQDYAQDVWHFAPITSIAGKDATIRTLNATMGGLFTRSVTEAILSGQGSSAEMLGCYFGDHSQRVDHRTLQHHAAANTTSDLYYKGALQGKSQAVYSGLVKIDHEAPESDAQQKNRNLLLSPDASADASPFLEILTSEVQRATHAVSVGRADAEVLFYLESRGLDPQMAQRLFVKGFFQEVIDRVRVESVREALEEMIESELELEHSVG